MKPKDLKMNMRVEYCAQFTIISESGVKSTENRQLVGYVKRVFRKWFTTYALISECKTHRLDKVRVKDIIGELQPRNAKGQFEKINK